MIKRYKFTHCSCWNHNEWNYDLSLWHLVTHAYIIYSYSPFFLIRCFDSLLIHGIIAFHGQFYHNFYNEKIITLHNVSQGCHFITLFYVKCIFMLVPIVALANIIPLSFDCICFVLVRRIILKSHIMNVTPTSNTPQITAKEKKRVRQVTSINVINIVKFELLLNPLVTTIFYFIYKI